LKRHGAASLPLTIIGSFLGNAPGYYKLALLAALPLNVILWAVAGPAVAGWAMVFEFIATLAFALQCYPLAPGGLLAIEALLLGLTTPQQVYHETASGLPIILLLVFMVAAIAFMQELLLLLFTRVLLAVQSPVALGLLFCAAAALLSAFLDALTVIAVVMAVALGLYRVYFIAMGGSAADGERHLANDQCLPATCHGELAQLRAALRGLVMHAAVGTALGGVGTLVGEPQNLLIGQVMGWQFMEFAVRVAPVALPVLLAGLLSCGLLSALGWCGYGVAVPPGARAALAIHAAQQARQRTTRDRWRLGVQGGVALLLVVALTLHWAEVGLIGLALIVLLTALTGQTHEHQLAEAMKGALPFTALLVVFFAIVALIHDQQLFSPVISLVLAQQGRAQIAWMYVANGLLSAISDNVFVATVYMSELQQAFRAGLIAPAQYAQLAVAVNTGTNIPSVATPNGQAAFLFLLTSALAPVLRLSYARMCWMAFPYFIVLSATGLLACIYLLR
jgi:NhaB family Na+:H+ antiporter